MYSTLTIPARRSNYWAENYTNPMGTLVNSISADLNTILTQYSQSSLALSLDTLKTEVYDDATISSNSYTDSEIAQLTIYVESLSFTGLPPENFSPNDFIKINSLGDAFEGVQISDTLATIEQTAMNNLALVLGHY